MKNSFIPTPDQLKALGLDWTTEKVYKHNYPPTDVYQQTVHWKLILFPGGWQGITLQRQFVEGEWEQVFMGEVQDEAEFHLMLRMVDFKR